MQCLSLPRFDIKKILADIFITYHRIRQLVSAVLCGHAVSMPLVFCGTSKLG